MRVRDPETGRYLPSVATDSEIEQMINETFADEKPRAAYGTVKKRSGSKVWLSHHRVEILVAMSYLILCFGIGMIGGLAGVKIGLN